MVITCTGPHHMSCWHGPCSLVCTHRCRQATFDHPWIWPCWWKALHNNAFCEHGSWICTEPNPHAPGNWILNSWVWTCLCTWLCVFVCVCAHVCMLLCVCVVVCAESSEGERPTHRTAVAGAWPWEVWGRQVLSQTGRSKICVMWAIIIITFHIRHSRGKMYIGHGHLCACLSVPCHIPTLLHRPRCNLREW